MLIFAHVVKKFSVLYKAPSSLTCSQISNTKSYPEAVTISSYSYIYLWHSGMQWPSDKVTKKSYLQEAHLK